MRRSKRTYIRLAAFFAAQPPDVDRLVLHLDEIEEVTGEGLPSRAVFPFWWSNDPASAHARAWLSSGWHVVEMNAGLKRVEFARGNVPVDDG